MNLKHIADGGAFDVTAAIRLLAAKVGALTGEITAQANMDGAGAGATLDATLEDGVLMPGGPKKVAGRRKSAADSSAAAAEFEGSE